MSDQGVKTTDTSRPATRLAAFPSPERGALAFGEYMALPASRRLLLRGDPVVLGDRAFDLLMVLLRFAGEVVTKDEIMRHVWPTTTVDDSNLRFQMARLRKVLGADRERIRTVTGRGYLFVADGNLTASSDPSVVSSRRLGTRAAAGSSPRRSTILIVDADPEIREALDRLLRPLDANVAVFGSMTEWLNAGTAPAPEGRHLSHHWRQGLSPCAGGRRPHSRRDRTVASSC